MEGDPGIRIVVVPYDSGHHGVRMGSGPDHLLNNGLPEALESAEQRVRSVTLHPDSDPPAEVATAFELDSLVSGEVRAVVEAGEFPLVLSGNCNTSVGTLSGVGTQGLGIVWFDAHADFNTPETTTTGFTDGMGLAIAVGHCWATMAKSVPNYSPVAEENVVLAGVREVEPSEQRRLAASNIAVTSADLVEEEGLGSLAKALDGLRMRSGRVYVHLDLDVLDPVKAGRANEFAPDAGGLSSEDLEMALGLVRERFTVAAAGIVRPGPRRRRVSSACGRRKRSDAHPSSRTRHLGIEAHKRWQGYRALQLAAGPGCMASRTFVGLDRSCVVASVRRCRRFQEMRMDLETNSAGKQEILASGVQGRTLVARTWVGRTRKELADEYLRYNYENGVLEVEKKPGCLGMQQFRKIRDDVAEFTTISYWSSMEAMEAAHGESLNPTHLEKDEEYLLELPESVEVGELHVNDWQLNASS
jgi:arginase